MAPKPKPAIERFLAKVREAENGCHEWTAGQNGRGYGVFAYGTRANPNGRSNSNMGMVLAHRWAYEYFVGPIPEGLTIDHLCRNRLCCNPAHLEVVTQRENTLRGESVSALAARRTHCPKGHPYSPENTAITLAGARKCVLCNRATSLAAQKRKAARDKALAEGSAVPSWAELRT